MDYKFTLLETQKVAIIYYYKVGSRFIENYFKDSKDFLITHPSFSDILSPYEFHTPMQVGNYYANPGCLKDDSFFSKTLKGEILNKSVLIIYRDPYQKTVSGLTEDFHEEIIRYNNDGWARYLNRDEFINYLNKFNYSETDLNILSDTFKNIDTRTTLETLEKTQSVTLQELYYGALTLYAEYRISNKIIGEIGHTEFYLHTPCKLIDMFHVNQKYKLLNLDSSDDNLIDELKLYHPASEHTPVKNHFSNSNFKKILENNLSSIAKERLTSILSDGVGDYIRLEDVRRREYV